MANNYNTSKSGIEIETSIFLDNDMSYVNFQENFIEIKHGSLEGKWLYIDYGNLFYVEKYKSRIDEYFEPEIIIIDDSKKSETLLRYELYREGYDYYENLKNYTLINMFEDYTDGWSLEEKEEFLNDRNIKYKFDLNIITTSTRGYCQGDYEEVVIIPDALRECWGTPDNIPDDELVSSDYIDKLFWDAPMCVRVTVNGEDYFVEEFDGQYQQWRIDEKGKQYYWGYDKEVVISDIVEQVSKFQPEVDLEVLREELEGVVPSEIQYW